MSGDISASYFFAVADPSGRAV